MQKVNDLLEESGGEINEQLSELMETTSTNLQKKIDNVTDYKRHLDESLAMVKARRKELQNIEKSISNQIDGFKGYVLSCMKRVGLNKIESPFSRLTIPKQRDVLSVVNEKLIPIEYFNHVPEQYILDKKKLLDAIKSGEIIEGARLEKGSESILIKHKG
jgi:hypothetical protein